MIELLTLAGWTAAALALGLWYGERGRRIDAQIREGKIPLERRGKPTVTPDHKRSPPETAGELKAGREAYIDEAVQQGFDAADAGKDFDAMMGRAGVDQSVADGWGGAL